VPTAANVTISGFLMKHAGTQAQGWAIGNNDQLNFTIKNSTLSDAHGGMLNFGGGDLFPKATGNILTRAGNTAIASYNDGHATIQGNTISNSGFGGWDWTCQAGGVKMVFSHNLLMDGNTVTNVNGPGLWCDIQCDSVTIVNNHTADSPGPGIFYEISTNASISGNLIERAGGSAYPGLYISSSSSTDVANNTVRDSYRGIQAYDQDRTDKPGSMNNVFLHDNNVYMNHDGLAMFIGDYGNNSSTTANNRGSNNHFKYPNAENGVPRWQYGLRTDSTLTGFRTTALGQGATYLP